jgi:hypothetical protein
MNPQSYGIPKFVESDLGMYLGRTFETDAKGAAAGIAFVSRNKDTHLADALESKWHTTQTICPGAGLEGFDFCEIFGELVFPMIEEYGVIPKMRKLMLSPSVRLSDPRQPLLVYCCLTMPNHRKHPNPTEAVSKCADEFLEGLIRTHKQKICPDQIINTPLSYRGQALRGRVTHSIFPFWMKANFDYAGCDPEQSEFYNIGLADHLRTMLEDGDSDTLTMLKEFYTDVKP